MKTETPAKLPAKSPLRRRFVVAIIIYTGAILALWLVYQNITNGTIAAYARENTMLAADGLTGRIGAEFAQMGTFTASIAASAYVQDFLMERDVAAWYGKAEVVTEIIQQSAYPITSSDSVIVFGMDGNFYRFSGGLSHEGCETLNTLFRGVGSVYTVATVDDTLFFCYNTPVHDMSHPTTPRIGNVVMLTRLDKMRRMLEREDAAMGIDMALVFEGQIILSGNPELEGMPASGIEPLYGAVTVMQVAGAGLSVAAAIPGEALNPDSTLSYVISGALLALLVAIILVLYRYLSSFLVRPMLRIIAHVRAIGGGWGGRLPTTGKKDFDTLVSDINAMLDRTDQYYNAFIAERKKLYESEFAKQNMRLGLLATQMDAHFVVNTLQNIKRLLDKGDTDSAGRMAGGLASILRHRHTGDAYVNIFDDFQILEKYVDIMNIKYGDKFNVEYDVDDRLEAFMMPGLILQPIVENALTHGLAYKEGDARLVIKGCIVDDKVVFELADNGAGILEKKLRYIQHNLEIVERDDFPEAGLRGIALRNVQRRIRIRCGDEYGIFLDSTFGSGTTVTVTLPLVPDDMDTRPKLPPLE
jgi:signal transduction histidine kinase